MARINPIPERDLPAEIKLALQSARSQIAQFTGRKLEHGVEPWELYARLPQLFTALQALGQVGGQLTGIDKRTHALAQLKAATMTQCEFCIDVGSLISRQWGLSDEELLALPSYRTSLLFSEVEKLVLDYAVGMSRTPAEVPDELFEQLEQHFDDAQLIELTHIIASENMTGRFNKALGVRAAGFSEGMVCAAPISVA